MCILQFNFIIYIYVQNKELLAVKLKYIYFLINFVLNIHVINAA